MQCATAIHISFVLKLKYGVFLPRKRPPLKRENICLCDEQAQAQCLLNQIQFMISWAQPKTSFFLSVLSHLPLFLFSTNGVFVTARVYGVSSDQDRRLMAFENFEARHRVKYALLSPRIDVSKRH